MTEPRVRRMDPEPVGAPPPLELEWCGRQEDHLAHAHGRSGALWCHGEPVPPTALCVDPAPPHGVWVRLSPNDRDPASRGASGPML